MGKAIRRESEEGKVKKGKALHDPQISYARKFLKGVENFLKKVFHDLNNLLTFKRPSNVKKL